MLCCFFVFVFNQTKENDHLNSVVEVNADATNKKKNKFIIYCGIGKK